MTREKQEQYNLKFTKLISNEIEIFHCESTNKQKNESLIIASVLRSLNDTYAEVILLSIQNSQNNDPYEEFHQPDSLDDSFEIKITPQYCFIGDLLTIPSIDFKELMIEWLNFLKK